MVEIFGLEQGTMHPAGEHRRYAKLCQSADMLADESMAADEIIQVEQSNSRSVARFRARKIIRRIVGDRSKTQLPQENILSFIWISAGAGSNFAVAAALSPRVTS